MRDLQGHSAAASSSSYSFDDDDDSENITQPPPQHPLLEPHQLDCEREQQEKSISDDMMEENLFDCAIQYQQQADNFINYCRSNDPHQSINKPTDGTGSNNNIINYHYDHQRGSPQSSSRSSSNSKKEAPVDQDDESERDYDDEDDDVEDELGDANLNHNNHHLLHHHHHHHQLHHLDQQQQQQQPRSRPILAASSPIQVPARRTRKDFYSMKLNMLKVEESAAAEAIAIATADESTTSSTTTSASSTSTSGAGDGVVSEDSEDYSPVRRGDRNRPAIENMPAFDDDDAFLDREFNENHYNHYLLDGLDDEHLTAEEDPMRLFASIQALAKSLHEDAELFGSLPPKRTLESPIRSIAFV